MTYAFNARSARLLACILGTLAPASALCAGCGSPGGSPATSEDGMATNPGALDATSNLDATSDSDGEAATDAGADGPGLGAQVGDGGGDVGAADSPDAMPTALSACAAYAQSFCERFSTCDPRTFLTDYFASFDVCVARRSMLCPAEFNAAGTGATPSRLAACARATAAQTCGQWHAGLPIDCLPQGALDNDAGCEYDSQCKSTLCLRKTTGWCGTCQDRPGDGGACGATQIGTARPSLPAQLCQPGLACAAACNGPPENGQCGDVYGWVCTQPVPDGGACDKMYECDWGLTCVGSSCVPAFALGQPCQHWWECAGDTACPPEQDGGRVCVPDPHVAPGGACNPAFAQPCAGGAPCAVPDGGTSDAATCGPEPAEGAPCIGNDQCFPPALCQGGICEGPVDPSTCN